MTKKINFSRMGGPVFSGRERGRINREKYRLDEIDYSAGTVDVIIPDNTYAVTSSFFLGLFGRSVQALGGREQFCKKYNIKSPDRFDDKIGFYIELATREKTSVLAKH